MPRCLGKLLVALSLGLASPVLAQDAAAPDNRIMLELNGAADTEAGGCQLTIVATNQLETGIRRAAWQVAIFDKSGAVQSLPAGVYIAMNGRIWDPAKVRKNVDANRFEAL